MSYFFEGVLAYLLYYTYKLLKNPITITTMLVYGTKTFNLTLTMFSQLKYLENKPQTIQTSNQSTNQTLFSIKLNKIYLRLFLSSGLSSKLLLKLYTFFRSLTCCELVDRFDSLFCSTIFGAVQHAVWGSAGPEMPVRGKRGSLFHCFQLYQGESEQWHCVCICVCVYMCVCVCVYSICLCCVCSLQ